MLIIIHSCWLFGFFFLHQKQLLPEHAVLCNHGDKEQKVKIAEDGRSIAFLSCLILGKSLEVSFFVIS